LAAFSPVFRPGKAVGIQRQPLLFGEAAFDAGDIPAQAAKLRPRPSGKGHDRQCSLFVLKDSGAWAGNQVGTATSFDVATIII
jgi:hypothetical protein